MKRQFEKDCAYCGETFVTSNYRKKYCGSTCRTYASLERTGKLNDVQQAILKGEIQPISGTSTAATPTKDKETLITDILVSHLESLFSLDNGDLYFYNPRAQNEDLPGQVNPHEDIEMGIRRVTVTPSGNFIVTSMCKPAIERIRERYEGSDIFEGNSPEYDDPITIAPNQFGKPREDIKPGRKFSLLTFNTILKREDVIKKAGVNVKLI